MYAFSRDKAYLRIPIRRFMADRQNAKALRVIGQDLALLGVAEFSVGRRGDNYTVRFDDRTPSQMPDLSIKGTLRSFSGAKEFARPVSKTLHFFISELIWKNAARSFNRKGTEEITGLCELSLMLRAVGNYLDDNESDDFIILWERNLVKVLFGQREQNFRLVNLYERGTGLYLKKRSNDQQ